jgi:hypothetical protein
MLASQMIFLAIWLTLSGLVSTGAEVEYADAAVNLEREWTDGSGGFTVRARMVSATKDTVTIERTDNGKTGTIPVGRLSKSDQQYAKMFQDDKLAIVFPKHSRNQHAIPFFLQAARADLESGVRKLSPQSDWQPERQLLQGLFKSKEWATSAGDFNGQLLVISPPNEAMGWAEPMIVIEAVNGTLVRLRYSQLSAGDRGSLSEFARNWLFIGSLGYNQFFGADLPSKKNAPKSGLPIYMLPSDFPESKSPQEARNRAMMFAEYMIQRESEVQKKFGISSQIFVPLPGLPADLIARRMAETEKNNARVKKHTLELDRAMVGGPYRSINQAFEFLWVLKEVETRLDRETGADASRITAVSKQVIAEFQKRQQFRAIAEVASDHFFNFVAAK